MLDDPDILNSYSNNEKFFLSNQSTFFVCGAEDGIQGLMHAGQVLSVPSKRFLQNFFLQYSTKEKHRIKFLTDQLSNTSKRVMNEATSMALVLKAISPRRIQNLVRSSTRIPFQWKQTPSHSPFF